jgi:hypothetical protein
MDVEFSMPHLLPDGSPLPPSGQERETLNFLYDNNNHEAVSTGLKSMMALNDYHTHETMIFDTTTIPATTSWTNSWKNSIAPEVSSSSLSSTLVLHPGTTQEQSYARTAHSEGEMFGLSTCCVGFLLRRVNIHKIIPFLRGF